MFSGTCGTNIQLNKKKSPISKETPISSGSRNISVYVGFGWFDGITLLLL